MLAASMAIIFTLFFVSLLAGLSSVLAFKTFMDREKSSPFECGFDPKGSARLPFSLRFFLIAIIFLIFDVEVVLLLPLVLVMRSSSIGPVLELSFFFLFILLIGLYYEWGQGALEWSK